MEFRIIEYNTPEYEDMVSLRNIVLREPIGLDFSLQDREKDRNDILLGAYFPNNGEIIGACILTPLNDYTVQLRQMAIAGFCQGKGVGTGLLDYAEQIAIQQGYNYIYLHARKVAVGFYKKNGYAIDGGEFIEVGIPHYEMLKILKQ